jgi:hypothetical protein
MGKLEIGLMNPPSIPFKLRFSDAPTLFADIGAKSAASFALALLLHWSQPDAETQTLQTMRRGP